MLANSLLPGVRSARAKSPACKPIQADFSGTSGTQTKWLIQLLSFQRHYPLHNERISGITASDQLDYGCKVAYGSSSVWSYIRCRVLHAVFSETSQAEEAGIALAAGEPAGVGVIAGTGQAVLHA